MGVKVGVRFSGGVCGGDQSDIITKRESVMGKFRFRGVGWRRVVLGVEWVVLVLTVVVWLLWLWLF